MYTLFLYFFLEKVITSTWEKLRENYRKALNRRKRATKSGAGGNPTSTCRFFKELSFLSDIIGVRCTQSNMTPDLFTPPLSPVSTVQHEPVPSPAIGKSSSVTPRFSNSLSTMRPTLSHENTKKRRNSSDSSLQTVLEKAITADLEKAKEVIEDDPDELFCKSLVSSLKSLPNKKNKRAKIQMMQILLDMDSDSD